MSLIPLGILAGSGGKATSFESIATATGTGSSGTITFSSIPSTFQHLQIRIRGLTTTGGQSINMRINGDTGNNYSRHILVGDGSTAYAVGAASTNVIHIFGWSLGTSTTQPTTAIIDLLDYASTSKNKTVKTFAGIDTNGSGEINLASGAFFNTSAVSSISLIAGNQNWTTSSTIALYGIKGA